MERERKTNVKSPGLTSDVSLFGHRFILSLPPPTRDCLRELDNELEREKIQGNRAPLFLWNREWKRVDWIDSRVEASFVLFASSQRPLVTLLRTKSGRVYLTQVRFLFLPASTFFHSPSPSPF